MRFKHQPEQHQPKIRSDFLKVVIDDEDVQRVEIVGLILWSYDAIIQSVVRKTAVLAQAQHIIDDFQMARFSTFAYSFSVDTSTKNKSLLERIPLTTKER